MHVFIHEKNHLTPSTSFFSTSPCTSRTRFCKDYFLVPHAFSTTKCRELFAQANVGKFRNKDRATLSLAEFTNALSLAAKLAHPDNPEALSTLVGGDYP